jgi:hypothetical protein
MCALAQKVVAQDSHGHTPRPVSSRRDFHRWQFGCVFGHPRGVEDREEGEFEKFVVGQCRVFVKAGCEVGVVERSDQTCDRIIVVLKMDEENIRAQYRRLEVERWKATGAGIMFKTADKKVIKKVDGPAPTTKPVVKGANPDHPIQEILNPTPADVVQVLGDVLRYQCKLGDLDHLHTRYSAKADQRIRDVFPLKDYEWQRDFLRRWTREGGIVKSCKRIRTEFHGIGLNMRHTIGDGMTQARKHGAALAIGAAARLKDARTNVHTHAKDITHKLTRSVSERLSPKRPDPNAVEIDPASLPPGGIPTPPKSPESPRLSATNLVASAKSVGRSLTRGTTSAVMVMGRGASSAVISGAKGARSVARTGVKSIRAVAGFTGTVGVRSVKGCCGMRMVAEFLHRLATAFWLRDDVRTQGWRPAGLQS